MLSASERCFKYSNIKYINDNAPEIVLQTCKKLAIKGKRDQCVNYLGVFMQIGNFHQNSYYFANSNELTKTNVKQEFEFKRDNDKGLLF